MANKKEIVINLTEEQRSQIKKATGKDITMLRIELVEADKAA